MVDDYPVPADEVLAAVQYSPLPCHDVLVVEPPYAWTADVNPRLLVLPARGERLPSGFTLWWERAANSFAVAGQGQVFGRRGTLNATLDATGCLYHEGGLDVTFTSPDDDLDDMPFDEGVGTKRFRIFIAMKSSWAGSRRWSRPGATGLTSCGRSTARHAACTGSGLSAGACNWPNGRS